MTIRSMSSDALSSAYQQHHLSGMSSTATSTSSTSSPASSQFSQSHASSPVNGSMLPASGLSAKKPPRQRSSSTGGSLLSHSIAVELMQPFFGLSRYLRVLFVLYILISLVYTLLHFYALFYRQPAVDPSMHSASLHSATASPRPLSGAMFRERTVVGKILLEEGAAASTSASVAPASLDSTGSVVPTGSDRLSGTSWMGHFEVLSDQASSWGPLQDVTEDMLFSKMFQYALKPSKIVPHFYRMSDTPARSDITICTMITIERLDVFANLLAKYQGPMSVAIHISNDETRMDALERLHVARKNNPQFLQYVDVHLIIDTFERQFNLWRNVARFFSRTDLILAMDVDFMLCTDIRFNFNRLPANYRQLVYNASAVFVVPAFEFVKTAAEGVVEQYPVDKPALLKLIESKELEMFHNRWKRGHGPTDYESWYKSAMPYQVIEYNYSYEPYVLMRCDERFVGYGANKAACLYEIFLHGAQFWVMPDDFLIHQRHPYPENDRRVERKYNRRLYDAFREEACLRYGRMGRGVDNRTRVDERICGANFPVSLL